MADGISVWFPVITAMAGIGGALGSQYVSHRFALQREESTAARKRQDELLFIATELVFLLEEFAECCASAASDTGREDNEGILRITVERPDINFTQVSGDWRVLPPRLMYRIRELPILVNEADEYVESAWANDWPPDYSRTFEERQY